MATAHTIYVIGIGYRPLDKKSREIVLASEVILANDRMLAIFKEYDEFETVRDRLKLLNNVNETMEFIRENHKIQAVTLLATGDPMFFGIGRKVVNEFGKDMVEILPDLSSVQLAFSRIKEPWSDAMFISLHGGPDPDTRRETQYEPKDVPHLFKTHNKIAILTDRINNPAVIAKEFLQLSALSLQQSALKMHVFEKLGYADEKITTEAPEEIAKMNFSHPNLLIIMTEQETDDSRQSGSL